MANYHQLTREQRYQIGTLKQAGFCQKDIAFKLRVHDSTISRELKRNSISSRYDPERADKLAHARCSSKGTPKIPPEIWMCVRTLLCRDWSPEQISGRLFKENGYKISHESIYQYVYADKRSGGELYRHLHCQKKRKKRYGSYDTRGEIPNRLSIEERPEIVNKRERIGDWEGDTIIGAKHKGALVTLVERKTLFTVIGHAPKKNAPLVAEQVCKALSGYKDIVHSITFDNGKEFAQHETIAVALEAQVYFAHPYASWERGVNENTNGLIRQYLPKNTDLTHVPEERRLFIMDRLNNRPRKTLGFKTPYEVLLDVSIKQISFARS